MITYKIKDGYIARFWLGCWVNVLANNRLDAIKMALEYIDAKSK